MAQVDLIGTNYEERIIATGYGSYICVPLLRNALEKNPGLGQEEARKVFFFFFFWFLFAYFIFGTHHLALIRLLKIR